MGPLALALVASFGAFAGAAFADVVECDAEVRTEPATELIVEVVGVPEAAGNLRIGVYDSAELFTRDGGTVCRGLVSASGPQVRTAAFRVRRGWYAVAVGHDRNENGEVDRVLVPTEAYGFSNYPLVPFGRPLFEQARFEVSDAPKVVVVPVSYHPTLRGGERRAGSTAEQR